MPAIPQYQQRVSAQSGELGPGPRRSAGSEFALAAEFTQTAQKIQLSNESWQLADATAKATGELQAFRGELASDEDFDTQSTRFLEHAKEVQEKYSASLGGVAARAFKDDFTRISQSNAAQVAIDAQKSKAQKVRTELGNTLFDLSQLTGQDPVTDDAIRAQARIAVEVSEKTGNLSFDEKNALLTKFDTDSSEAAIRRDMLGDPELAERKLAAGAYPHLSGESQAIWAQRVSSAAYSAQQRRLAEEDRDLRMNEKARKDYADKLSKDGDRLLSQNALTPTWLERNRTGLDPNDYRYFYQKLSGSGGDAPRNSELYANLRDRAGRGEDVRDDARDALHKGEIRTQDYDKVLSEVENERPGWYKRGSSYISTMAAVSDLNPDPAAAQNKAAMLDQWSDWAAEHPKASDREAQVAYQDIVSNNSLVQMSALPMPRFAVGNRFTLNLDATEDALADALKNGRIDQKEFQRQAQLIERWRSATHVQAPATPTAK